MNKIDHFPVCKHGHSFLIRPPIVRGRPLDVLNETYTKSMVDRASQLQKKYDALKKICSVDETTGLFNRKHFKEQLEREFLHFKDSQQDTLRRINDPKNTIDPKNTYNFSMIMIDLDHFKAVNDTYGHPKGDEVLESVSALIKRMVRQTDIPCRIGGEELVVLLPSTNRTTACEIAERMRRSIESITFESESRDFNITASFGVITVNDQIVSNGKIADTSDILHSVDKALYDSKKNGRNRVYCVALTECSIQCIFDTSGKLVP